MDQNFREATRVKRDATVVAAPAMQAVRRIDPPMGYWLDEPRDQNEFVRVRTVWVTITLSVLVHVVALSLVLEETRLLAPFDEGKGETDPLQVRLTAPPQPVPVPAPAPQPPREVVALPKPARATKPPASREPPPPMLAATAPQRALPTPALPAPPVPAPARPPAEGDLLSYIQARRRERGESAPAVDAPKAEPNANLAANLPTAATGVATPDPRRGGGIFEIKRMDYDDAAFLFFGWNKDMGRRTPQLIEVRKGNNTDMRIAVVRKMIEIIREHEKGDFEWQSPHHTIMLSARVSDNAQLENFLLHDLFDDPGQARVR